MILAGEITNPVQQANVFLSFLSRSVPSLAYLGPINTQYVEPAFMMSFVVVRIMIGCGLWLRMLYHAIAHPHAHRISAYLQAFWILSCGLGIAFSTQWVITSHYHVLERWLDDMEL